MTKEELFNQNIKLAYYIANRYRTNYLHEIEDIKQISLLGLWKAVNKYNGKIKFATFACAVMLNDINYYLRHVKKHDNLSYLEQEVSENITLADVLALEKDEIEALERELDVEIVRKYIDEEVTKMGRRDQGIYISLMQGKTQSSTAKEFGISQGQVNRIRQRIINDTKKLIGGISA